MKAWNLIVSNAVFVLTISVPAFGQANFSETFENNGLVQPGEMGPENLINQGWIFRNQSNPVDGVAWFNGNGFGGMPFEGAGYVSSSSSATDFFGGALSTWAILPDIPGLQAGDELSVWLFGGGAFSVNTFFELRRSPSGGTNTGSTPTDVGDFTDLLFSVELPLNASAYQQVLVALSGPGRLAFRFQAPFISTFPNGGAIISLDMLTVGPPPPPPCNVPIPQPGQSMTWTAAGSPYDICQDLGIPAGATVTVEPGVAINFNQSKLTVSGQFIAHGTPALPVVFSGNTGFQPAIEVIGEVDISEANIGVRVTTQETGSLLVADSTIGPGGHLTGVARFASVERCDFSGGELNIAASIRVVDCQFTQGSAPVLSGLDLVDNLTVDGQSLTIERESVAQPTFVNNVSVTNNATGAGLRVRGANYYIGPNVTTQGNLYPLEIFLTGGGVLPGSTLPQAGNINNYIPAGEFIAASDRHWANVGLPYVVNGFHDNRDGVLTIEPGTTVQFQPGAGAFLVKGSTLNAFGTPTEPITFEPFDPAQGWFGLKWVTQFSPILQHCIFDNAQIAVQSDESRLFLQECLLSNNQIGGSSSTSGTLFLHKSRVLNNTTGLTTTATGHLETQGIFGPNAFENNTLAVNYLNTTSLPEMTRNWWNSPTGPTTPQNPGGTGDPVQGLASGTFTPFQSAPPDFSNHIPTVQLTPIYFMVNSGQKIILRWNASDDTGIVSQRVEFAPYGFTYQTIAQLSPGDRSYEFTAPIVLPSNLSTNASGIRIVAVDDAGQESWDDARFFIPYQEDWTVTPQTITGPPTVAAPGETIDVCWDPGATSSAFFLVDGDGLFRGDGGGSSCLPIGSRTPWISSDTARVVIRVTFGAGGREAWHFSDYFSIRPDTRFGDAPPAITLDSPIAGQQFAGGSIIPVRWTASDDEGLRAFHIQASYDGGKTWHFVEKNIPGTSTGFDWQLPASSGISDVRIRVVAIDQRFQSSSDGDNQSVTITAGVQLPPGDINGDGITDTNDIPVFTAVLIGVDTDLNHMAAADMNADGAPNGGDMQLFLGVLIP